MYKIYEKKIKEGGYTILLAVLVTSLLLSVALGTFEIALKEAELSSFFQESQKAFYAADRALDCALFWHTASDRPGGSEDSPGVPFSNGSAYTYPSDFNTFTCEGINLGIPTPPNPPTPPTNWTRRDIDSDTATTDFDLSFSNKSCAHVRVLNDGVKTTITADGFNNCTVGFSRRVQRTLESSTEN